MINLKKRIEKLEKHTGAGDSKSVWLVVVKGDMNKEAADAKVQAAKAEYRARNPDQAEKEINIILVRYEEEKETIEKLLEKIPERTRKLESGGT